MDHTADAVVPRYRQVAQAIEDDIAAGRLKTGARLPSERLMAETLQISRMTARQAIQHLTRRGLLEARVGAGTFVRAPAIHQELSTLTGFTEEMERQGRPTTSIVVEAVTRDPDPETAAALALPAGGQVHRLTRVRLVDGAPVAVETSEIDARRAPGLFENRSFAGQSIYRLLERDYAIRPSTAEQTLEADAAGPETALQLNLTRGAPVLRLTRLTRDADGRAFEFARSVYRGDAFSMKVKLTIGTDRA